MATSPIRTSICLTLAVGPGAEERLAAALGAAAIASVIIHPAAGGAALVAADVQPLVALAQSRGAAALIEGDARLARTLRADGVHLPWSPELRAAFDEAREIVGSRAIVGIEAGSSRHDAMELGEAGADYVAFREAADPRSAEPAPEEADVTVGALAGLASDQLGLVEWWSEIFEIPVVALEMASDSDAEAAAAAGADFIAMAIRTGVTPAAVAEDVARTAARLRIASGK